MLGLLPLLSSSAARASNARDVLFAPAASCRREDSDDPATKMTDLLTCIDALHDARGAFEHGGADALVAMMSASYTRNNEGLPCKPYVCAHSVPRVPVLIGEDPVMLVIHPNREAGIGIPETSPTSIAFTRGFAAQMRQSSHGDVLMSSGSDGKM